MHRKAVYYNHNEPLIWLQLSHATECFKRTVAPLWLSLGEQDLEWLSAVTSVDSQRDGCDDMVTALCVQTDDAKSKMIFCCIVWISLVKELLHQWLSTNFLHEGVAKFKLRPLKMFPFFFHFLIWKEECSAFSVVPKLHMMTLIYAKNHWLYLTHWKTSSIYIFRKLFCGRRVSSSDDKK